MIAAGVMVATVGFAATPASAATSPTAPGEPETVTSVPLPTAQIDGVAWTQAIAGDTVFVGGEFTTARPAGAAPGVNTSPRANLMAYTLSTGVMTPWNPGANGAIRSIVASSDGSTIYVGGTFTTIAGVSRSRIAAFNAATGALLPWNPAANGPVNALAVRGGTVWIGGDFNWIGGASRPRIAAVSASTAKALPFTATLTGGYGVRALVADPTGSKVVVGGSFESTNGSTNPGRGMAALDGVTGASMPWAVNGLIRNAGLKAAMYSLTSDGDSVYGSGYDYGGGSEDGFEGVFRANWSDGSLLWLEDCHGDTYSVAVSSGVVYSASHAHYCGNIGGFPQTSPTWSFHHSLAFAKDYLGNVDKPDIYGYKSYAGQPAATLLNWFPEWQVGTYTGKSQAAWTITANDNYVVYGGEFPKINNIAQQGLVRFAKKSVAPDTDGPTLTGTDFPVSALSIRAGEVRLSWSANWDRDDTRLTYQLYRSGVSAPIYETTVDSNFWTLPDMQFVDKTVVAGKTYQYRVRAIDPNGNAAMGAYTTATASATSASDYSTDVLSDGAVNYWPLTDTSATVATNWASGSDLVVNSATRGAAGPNLATPSTATTFGGTNDSFAASKTLSQSPNTFSVEAWVNTTSTAGGKIVGFGNAKTGDSGNYDRHVYMSGDGRITFGLYPGDVRTVSSDIGFNDGNWHYVVATLGSDGMNLYVDGKRVDSRSDTTTGQDYTGYWRVGGDNLAYWPNTGSSNYLAGSISDVAVYDKVITRAQINDHWVKSGRASVIPAAPSDAYGAAVYSLDPTLYWRVGETAGATKALDSASDGNQGTYYGNVTQGVAGALTGVSNTAIALNPNGGHQTGIASDSSFNNPTTFALETWFKTDSTSGGKILGFGSSQTGLSGSYDRHIYMASDGTVKFGVWTGSAQVVQSGPGLNDNKWHYVVAQLSSNGMELYIDGSLVSTSANTGAQDYSGYWRVGGDNGWEGDQYWRGSVDEVAVYPTPLTAAQVSSHFSLGSGSAPVNQPPVATFSLSAVGLAASFDGSASSDAEGLVTAYAWDFGDGQTGTGAAASHTYAAAGTYTVTLTVTDEARATGTVSHQVTVAPVNQPPTAAFTSSVTGLVAALDGSGSSDAEGPVASYAWNFGDGQTGSGATASHTYAAAGTYHVTLTVTDAGGATGTVSQDVVIPPVNQPPVAVFTSSMSHLAGSFDASDSSDAEGPIASYAWNFGDGQSGTGRTASHTYAAAGTYHVTLTVTDGAGATATVTNDVIASAAPVNQPPTAAFTSSTTGLAIAVDASDSADAEGPIASYAWTFGDSQTGTGKTGTHTYAAAGTYSVTLTVTDGAGATATVSHDVTVVPVNQPPTAAFTSSTNGMAASFDGTSSTDAEGPIASYAWDFGDGQTGSGATTSHTYAAAGTYHVTLTVTDGGGATAAVNQDVVIVVVSNVIGRDAFDRTLANGWGQADVGGSWSIASGSASAFSVAGGAGLMTVRSSTGLRATLAAASSANTRIDASFSVNKIAAGHQINLIGRRVGTDTYSVRAQLAADGTVKLIVLKNATNIGAALTVPGLIITPGTMYTLSFAVTGTNSTSLSAKLWKTADTEPTTWQISRSDATASLQAAGGVGIDTFVPTAAAAYPVTVSFGDVTVTDPTIG